MDNMDNVYYVPVYFESYGRIPVEVGDHLVNRGILIDEARKKLEKMPLSELDMLTDYLPDSEGVDEEGIITDCYGNIVDL